MHYIKIGKIKIKAKSIFQEGVQSEIYNNSTTLIIKFNFYIY